MRAPRWKKLVVIFLCGMAMLHVLALWKLRDYIVEGFGDFASSYTAGELVRRGRASEIYSVSAQWELQQQFAPEVKSRRSPLRYVHLPFEALVFLPLAYFPYAVANWLWLAIKLCILFAIARLLRPFVIDEELLPPMMGAALSIGTFPIAADLIHGQDAILFALCIVLAFRAWQSRMDFRSGCFLALGLFKFHLVLPVVFVFFLKRRWKVVSGFLAGGAGVFLISLLLVGWKCLAGYPRYLWELNTSPSAGLPPPEVMPNVRTLMTALVTWSGVPYLIVPVVLVVVIVGAVFTASVWRSDADQRVTAAGFSLCLVTAILTSYYAYTQDMSMLLLPIWVLGSAFVKGQDLSRPPRMLFVAGAGLLLFSPLFWFLELRTRQFYLAAIVMLLLLGAALATAIREWGNQLSHSVTSEGGV